MEQRQREHDDDGHLPPPAHPAEVAVVGGQGDRDSR